MAASTQFKCKFCGGLVSPPEILPPMILGGKANYGEFHIKIDYPCEKCGENQHTSYRGNILIDSIEVLVVKTK